jgi:hypothetical protein
MATADSLSERCSNRHRVAGLARVSTREVVAQVAVVVQVFIAQGQAIDTLLEQFKQRVITAGLAAGISKDPGNRSSQSHLGINLCQQRDATVAGDVAAVKIGFNFSAFDGWKWERILVAFCHGGISCCLRSRHPYFQDLSAVLLSPS